MPFVITGMLRREPVVGGWTDEPDPDTGRHFTGDESLVAAVEAMAADGERASVTPTGPAIVVDLADEWATFVAARHVLNDHVTTTDEPAPPEGYDEDEEAFPDFMPRAPT